MNYHRALLLHAQFPTHVHLHVHPHLCPLHVHLHIHCPLTFFILNDYSTYVSLQYQYSILLKRLLQRPNPFKITSESVISFFCRNLNRNRCCKTRYRPSARRISEEDILLIAAARLDLTSARQRLPVPRAVLNAPTLMLQPLRVLLPHHMVTKVPLLL